jgi:uncharacterized repeat protein (TIGR01451 family)
LWAIVLSALWSVAWQDASPLSITASCAPESPTSGEVLTCTFTVSNSGTAGLEEVVVRVPVPEGTAFEQAAAPSGNWAIEEPDAAGEAVYRAQVTLVPQGSEELVLAVRVEAATGTAIRLAGYTAVAEGLGTPVEGAPVGVWVGVTPTPSATATATSTPAPTATPQPSPSPTGTAPPSPTPSPSPTAQPSPTTTPTPTITVVAGEIPTMPPPTATPNLSSEQVRIGTVTVSIFAGLVTMVVIASVVWIVRSSGKREPDAEE